MRAYVPECCDMLREEVVNGTDASVTAAALGVVKALAAAASHGVTVSDGAWCVFASCVASCSSGDV